MKRVKSFQPHSGFGVSTFFESHGALIGWYAFKRSVLKTLRFVSSVTGSSKIFCTTVWYSTSLPCRTSSTNKSYIVYSKSPVRSMRSFSVAMMHIFCQSLIGCSRSVDRAAHGPQTRQMAGFDRSQFENYVRRCRLLAASVLLPFVTADFFLTQPRSKVCRSVTSIFFFRPRAVERESKMCSLFCARGLRASDAIPESLHLTPSLPLLVFNMPRLLHSQVYLPIMWRRSSQFATKKGLKKFRFARRHSNPQGLFKGPYTGTEFFFLVFFLELRSFSHQKSFSRGQLGNQSDTTGVQFSILTTFRWRKLPL